MAERTTLSPYQAIDSLIIEAFNDIATSSSGAAVVVNAGPPPQAQPQQSPPRPQTVKQSPTSVPVVKAEQATALPVSPVAPTNGNSQHHQRQTSQTVTAAYTSPAVPLPVQIASTSAAASHPATAKSKRPKVEQISEESENSESDDASSGSSSDYRARAKAKAKASAKPAAKPSSNKRRIDEVDSEDVKPKAAAVSAALTDEEYARQLQAEFNAAASSRTTRGAGTGRASGKRARASGSTSKSTGGTKSKKHRTKAYIDDSDAGEFASGPEDGSEGSDAGEDAESKPAKKKRSGGGAGNLSTGYMKPLALSDSLAIVCGGPTMPRPHIVKKLWEYIREKELQDPTNRRK